MFEAHMVTLEPILEENEEAEDEDDLLTIIQFDYDGDVIMTDAWEEDKLGNVVEEEPNSTLDFPSFPEGGEEDVPTTVVRPELTTVIVPSLPFAAVPFAAVVPDSVQSVTAVGPAGLPAPAATVASATTGLPPRPATAVGTQGHCLELLRAPLAVEGPCPVFGSKNIKPVGGTKARRLFVGPKHGAAFWYSFCGSTRVTRRVAGCPDGNVKKKRPASVFKATMVALDPVVEEGDEQQVNEEDHLTITEFDDDGDVIMSDAWELENISTILVDDEEPNVVFDYTLITEDDLTPTPVVGDPVPYVVAAVPSSVRILVPFVAVDPSVTMALAAAPPAMSAPSVPSMAVPFAMAVPDSVGSVAAVVPATLPEPAASVASVTTGLPPCPARVVVAVPPAPTAMSVPSVPFTADVPFAMAVPDPVASPTSWICPSAASRSIRHVASTGPVSAPPVLRRSSARLAAKNAMRNCMGTIFIHGRRRSARLASRAF
jgi:hypothetical protein